jgi:hypothetical protein
MVRDFCKQPAATPASRSNTVDASKYSARAKAYHPLDTGLERLIRKALEELAEPVDVTAMIAEVFVGILDKLDDAAGIGPEDAINDNFAITRRQLWEWLNAAFWALDHDRLKTMVNTKDAVYMVARRLAPLIDDCVAQGILGLPSVPRARRQSRRPARTGKVVHITKSVERVA